MNSKLGSTTEKLGFDVLSLPFSTVGLCLLAFVFGAVNVNAQTLLAVHDVGGSGVGSQKMIVRYRLSQSGDYSNFSSSPKVTRRISSSSMDTVMRTLGQSGLQEFAAHSRMSWIGPSAGYRVITISYAGKKFELSSWHEQFESNSRLVVTDTGVQPLSGRTRAQALARTSSEYRQFRKLWETLMAIARNKDGILDK